MKASSRTPEIRWSCPSRLIPLLVLSMMIGNLASADDGKNNVGYGKNAMEAVGREFPEIADPMETEGLLWEDRTMMEQQDGLLWEDLSDHRRMQSVTSACRSSTDTLQSRASFVNEFQKVQDFSNDVATNRRCREFTVSQENTKLTCTMDFGSASHDLSNICTNVYGAIYSESNYTYRCDKNDPEDKDFLVYNELNVPLCVSIVCGQTGWRSYQVLGADAIGTWLASQAYPDSACDRLRLEPLFATLASDIPGDCGEDTDQIMQKADQATPGLASHRSAKAIDCTNTQTNGFNCAIDFSEYDHGFEAECEDNSNSRGIYIEVDYSISCTKAGTNLNLQVTNDPFCASRVLCEPAEYGTEAGDVRPISMITLMAAEGYTCTYGGDLVFEDFKRSLAPSISSSPSVSSAPSQVPSVSSMPSVSSVPSFVPSLQGCSGASSQLMSDNQVVRQAMDSIQVEIDKNPEGSYCTGSGQVFCDYDYTGIPHTLQEDCKTEGGKYTEHSFEIICLKPAIGEETVTRHIDRPFCLDDRCEYAEMSDFITEHYESQTPDSDTLCISYALTELLEGGRADVDAIPVSPGCQYETNQMSSTTAILNAKALVRSGYKEFASREIRNYCPSSQAGFLDCDFDFSSNILAITNNLNDDCPATGGQYLTTAFTVVCSDPVDNVQVTFKVRNFPNCVGFCCAPGESKTILAAEHTWFTDYYIIERGWTCGTIEIETLSTPNYNVDSACVTPAPGVVPTPAPVFVGQNQDCGEEHSVWGCYKGLKHPLFESVFAPQQTPTFAPTTTALNFNNFVEGGGRAAGDDDGGGLSGGAIAGIVIGVLLLLGVLSYFLFRAVRNRQEAEARAKEEDQSEMDFDAERQNLPFTPAFYDEAGYRDPDRGNDDDDARSYATDDWEGDENASTSEYTDSRDSRFSIDDSGDRDDGDDDRYDSDDRSYEDEDDDTTDDSRRRYT